MCAILTPATWQIAAAHPRVVLKTYIDDRSWSAPSLLEACQVQDRWSTWTALLGLLDNTNKSQYYHARAWGRRALVEHGLPVNNITSQPCILGNSFRGARARSANARETDRYNKSLGLVRRAACLPVPWQSRQKIVASVALSKAVWGTCLQIPTKNNMDRFDTQVAACLREPRYGSPDLRKLFRGHRLCFSFRVLEANFSAAWRLAQTMGEELGLWNVTRGWSSVITRCMRHFGWHVTSPWCWHHVATNARVSLDPSSQHWHACELALHKLREAWRCSLFQRWQASSRNDAAACSRLRYEEARLSLVRKACSSPSRFACMSGALMSPAAFGIATEHAIMCPFCRLMVGTTEHILWNCPAMCSVCEVERPRTPLDVAQRRLGWPCGQHGCYDSAVLAWYNAVRAQVLQQRYGR